MPSPRRATDREWRTRAACRTVDPELFFPTGERGPAYDREVEAAKRVCRSCPVVPECLADARARSAFGVAGGLTPEERRALPRPVDDEEPCVAPPIRGTAAETRATGRAAIRAGVPQRTVAAALGVTTRTTARWAAAAR